MRRGGPRRTIVGRPTIAVLAAAAVLLAGCRGDRAGGPAADAGHGTVVHVVDGDTVDVRLGGTTERIRLIGVDTPESVAHDRPVQCFGAEASAATEALLPQGTEVRVERDEVTRDRYGRLLAYVWRTDDDLLVNLALVEGGFADAVTFGDNEAVHQLLVAAEARARSDGVGLWSACGGPDVDIGPPSGE
jgi:micrococcal nuclease